MTRVLIEVFLAGLVAGYVIRLLHVGLQQRWQYRDKSQVVPWSTERKQMFVNRMD
jgi:hypothetical protein